MFTIKKSAFITPGVLLMFIATLAFAGMHSLIKYLSEFHVFEIIFFRSSITALFCTTYLLHHRIPFWGNNKQILVLRAFIGVVGMSLFFVTLQRMPMGASVSLKYLSPLFTVVFAVLLIGEKVRKIQWLAVLIALVGVLLLKGFDSRIDTLNLILGVTGALFGGLVYVIIRKIGHSEHPMVIINYFMLLAAFLSGIAMFPYWTNPSPMEWLLLIGIGVLGYSGQVYMTKSLQMEAASRVAPIKYLEVIYSLIIGLIWFGEGYTFLGFLGILLILAGMVVNLMFKKA